MVLLPARRRSALNTKKVLPQLGSPMGFYKLLTALHSWSWRPLGDNRKQPHTKHASQDFPSYCKSDSVNLWDQSFAGTQLEFALLFFPLSFLITKSVFVSALSPAAPSRSLYHLPFMAQLRLLCSRTWLSLPRCFIIFLVFSSKKKKSEEIHFLHCRLFWCSAWYHCRHNHHGMDSRDLKSSYS